jgi:predicted amidohydrolase YtcJ
MIRERNSRRTFLLLSGAGFTAALSDVALTSQALGADSDPGRADLVVLNAKVYTVDSQIPRAEAFAVKAGRFVAVGTTSEMKAFAGKGTEILDAKQMSIVPGFVDCHNHAPGDTLLYESLVGNPYMPEIVTIDSIIEKLRAKASQTPAGFWVEGFYYDDTKVKDNRPLNIHDLDQVSKDLPVVVIHEGGHTSYYNSKAFEMADVNRSTPNPPGGTFDRDPDGALNGRVTDNARRVFNKVGKRPTYTPEVKMQRQRDGLAFMSKQFVRFGVTSVCHESGDLLALQQVRERGELLHRVNYESSGEVLDSLIAAGIRTGFGDEWIRIGATSEHNCDGSFEERTMSRSTPYPGSVPPYFGNVTTTQSDLNTWVERVHQAGIEANCHANGDVAIDMVLIAYERALRLWPRTNVRHKITHCTLINDDLVRRIKAIGVVPNVFTTYLYCDGEKFHLYGEELMNRCMAFRTLLDAGIPAATGTDCPPGPFDPRISIQGMVTRKGWNGETWGAKQRVSVDEALRVNTLHGAYYMHEEAIKGSITPGKLADFVVLADDPHNVDPDKIKDIEIVRTVTGGSVVYRA